jgi:hypothetical protein
MRGEVVGSMGFCADGIIALCDRTVRALGDSKQFLELRDDEWEGDCARAHLEFCLDVLRQIEDAERALGILRELGRIRS